jgi:GST-like protein
MKLYGCKGCGSAVVEVMLQLAGIEYEYVDAIVWEPFKHHDDLVRLNPLKQVPTLVLDDGTVMTESAAIILWLCERMPHLVPKDPLKRALFYRWMIYLPANMYALAAFRDFPAKWVDGVEAQQAFRDKISDRLKELWLQLEAELQPAPYLLGREMSALDIYLAMIARWWVGRTWVAEHCPKIIGAVKLTEQHPVVANVWEKNFGK